jgi:hypothetical protein
MTIDNNDTALDLALREALGRLEAVQKRSPRYSVPRASRSIPSRSSSCSRSLRRGEPTPLGSHVGARGHVVVYVYRPHHGGRWQRIGGIVLPPGGMRTLVVTKQPPEKERALLAPWPRTGSPPPSGGRVEDRCPIVTVRRRSGRRAGGGGAQLMLFDPLEPVDAPPLQHDLERFTSPDGRPVRLGRAGLPDVAWPLGDVLLRLGVRAPLRNALGSGVARG